jgi:hypothetical protein
VAAREICLPLPVAPPVQGITVPGMGTVKALRSFTLEGYDVCSDARSMLNTLQPVFGALGIPLCILGCVTSITKVFSSDFPYINPAALGKVVTDCACLGTFTPFGFCGMLRSLVGALSMSMGCMVGLLGDVVAMEAQAGAMLADPATAFQGRCLEAQASTLRKNAVMALNPTILLFNSSVFLFTFVGVPVEPIGELAGEDAAQTLEALAVAQTAINAVATAITSVCP